MCARGEAGVVRYDAGVKFISKAISVGVKDSLYDDIRGIRQKCHNTQTATLTTMN